MAKALVGKRGESVEYFDVDRMCVEVLVLAKRPVRLSDGQYACVDKLGVTYIVGWSDALERWQGGEYVASYFFGC